MLEHIVSGLSLTLSIGTLSVLFLGTLYGTIMGALPGLGTVVALTICLPFTLNMDSASAIALLLGVYCGSVYGGSISAVLINTPGTSQSACTAIDGYAMAKQGRAGEALGWVTLASVFGGLFSCIVLIIAAPQMAALSVKYGGPLEICALITLGLACIATLSEGQQAKGILMGILGLFLATVGTDPVSGMSRFTFGSFTLESGITMLPLVIGIFPLAEVFVRIYEKTTNIEVVKPIECKKIIFPGIAKWKGRFNILLRSCGLGVLIGVLPGTGPTAATFISYASAKGTSPNAKDFGKGEPDGLIAAEASNNAVTGGALVPTLALGIPGDATLALLLGSFVLHNLTPGVRLMADHPDVVYASFILLILANFLIIPSAILTVRFFGYLLRIPTPLFLMLIILLSFIGAYISRNLYGDLIITIAIGFLGFIMRLWDFPASALLVGFVLGPQFEYRLGQVFIFKGETPFFTYLLQNPVGSVLLTITILVLCMPLIKQFRKRLRNKT